MSRRAATIEEVFDDDTDLPLPNRPLPNTGARGAILAELEDDDASDDESPGTASPSQPQFKQAAPPGRDEGRVTDITPYKKWTCVYPIYIDAKRPAVRGERRIARSKSVWWPLSKDIADVTSRLGLGTLHEVHKSHPRDWENPGRVRVQWKKDGRLLHPAIKNKKQLLEIISQQIQSLKPDNVPKPPYTTSTARATSPTPELSRPSTPAQKSAPSSKGKGATKSKPTSTPVPVPTSATEKKGRPKPPSPPAPWPALTTRVSPYSPALPSGVLIETIKAGMSAQEANPAVGAGAGGKGKRKVVRVRG